jgi:hypothetical protein
MRVADLVQERDRVSDDRAILARDQDVLFRDRAFGNWWSIEGDVNRVRDDRVQLNIDATTYDADRNMVPRTYTYRVERY